MASKRHHNILIIQTDELHHRMLGFQGAPGLRTPHLDRLAKERAVVFDQHYSCSGVCAPSRTSFITGRYPLAHGVVSNDVPRRMPGEPVLGRMLREAGYATGLFGKTHFGGDDENMPGEGWDESFLDGEQYNEYLRRHGIDARYPEGKDIVRRPARYWNFGQSRIPSEHYFENVLGDYGVDFIERHADERWACYVNCISPHNPFTAPGRYAEMYDPAKMVLAERFEDELEGKPKLTRQWIEQNRKYLNDDELRQWMAITYGLITMVDDNVGKLMDVLERRSLVDDTLIVFTSDHGDFASRYGIRGKSWTLTDDVVHTPLLIALPGAKARRTEAMAQNIDVTATLLEWAGLAVPQRMHGRSLMAVLRGEREHHRDCVFAHDQSEYSGGRLYQSMVRTAKWKYVEGTDFQSELYDMVGDPMERKNRADDPVCAEVAGQLRRELLQWHVGCAGGFYDADHAKYWEDETCFYDERVFCGERVKKAGKAT